MELPFLATSDWIGVRLILTFLHLVDPRICFAVHIWIHNMLVLEN